MFLDKDIMLSQHIYRRLINNIASYRNQIWSFVSLWFLVTLMFNMKHSEINMHRKSSLGMATHVPKRRQTHDKHSSCSNGSCTSNESTRITAIILCTCSVLIQCIRVQIGSYSSNIVKGFNQQKVQTSSNFQRIR